MIGSLYDYVIKETLGFHVDYSKTLGQQIEEGRHSASAGIPAPITQSQADSLTEKCENSIRSMHRPIVKSNTAQLATIFSQVGSLKSPNPPTLTRETYEYLNYTETEALPVIIVGRITSYNMNTFKGRIYAQEEHRPIPFILDEGARDRRAVSRITQSLSENAQNPGSGDIKCTAYRNYSRSRRLKSYLILEVSAQQ